MSLTIALMGLGEVGRIFSEGLLAQGHTLHAYDLKFDDASSVPSQTAKELGILSCSTTHQLGDGVDIIISAVTAEQTRQAAQFASSGIKSVCWYLDVNSASPQAKMDAADIISSAGGKFVEASIMSPINPTGMTSPVLLAGPRAKKFEAVAHQLGFSGASFYSNEPGKAAAAKLCRSVMVKGLEALITESLLAASHYGVEEDVLTSLNNLMPHPDWEQQASYMISRSVKHGVRRAEEMREAAIAVHGAGVTPHMSNACANRQAESAQYDVTESTDSLQSMLTVIRKTMKELSHDH